MRTKRYTLALLLSVALIAAALAIPAHHASAAPAHHFGTPVELGEPIQQAALFEGVYGKENGHDMVYTTSAGNPAMFNAVDLDANRLVKAVPLPEGKSAWSHTITPDGSVYIGVSDGGPILHRYNPDSGTIEQLGTAVSDAKSIWSLTVDENGNVYGGTFDQGKVFQYNPSTGQFRDYGVMVEGRDYVRSIAYHDGYVYAGIGSIGDIVKLNVETGEKTLIPLKPIDGVQQYPFVYGLDVHGDYLFAFLSGDGKAIYIIYDLASGAWLEEEYWGAAGLRASPAYNGKVYFLQNKELMAWDMATREAVSTGISYGSSLRNSGWVELEDDPGFKNPVLATVHYGGSVALFDVEAGKVTTRLPGIQGSALSIHALEKGPGGKLFMSGYTAATAAVYDPAIEQFSTFTMGQAESIGISGSRVYYGEYPGASIHKYDTALPLQPDAAKPNQNPVKLLQIGESQDRPYVNTFGDGKAFFGTIPSYGEIGGALAVFEESDPQGTLRVYRNIVPGQSIVGLAYRDGLIYGSTTIRGGLDSATPETRAKMFIWDVAKEQKIAEWEPNIPGASKAPIMISGLTFDKDGLLWAAADGALFAIDPQTKAIVKSKQIFSGVQNYGMWRPIHFRFSDDGFMYADLYGKLIAVDPETLAYVDSGIATALFDVGDDGRIYYAQEGRLMSVALEEEQYASPGELRLTAPIAAVPGTTFEIRVRMDEAVGLYGANMAFSFDPRQLELKEIKRGDSFGEGAFLDSRIDQAGGSAFAVVSATGANGVNGNMDILRLLFEAKEGSGQAAVVLKKGSTVGAVHTPDSGVLYPTDRDLTVSVALKQHREDVNGDGKVSIEDLVAVAKQAGKPGADERYDLNGDGKVDVTDVALVALILFED
ncbi:dockerin type I domain-containing protein [Paenibacillus sp. NPDC057967]|uniref:dockerin type I domain-containing protein n=1 Tax=Paenibacillus sp. NPDC057967 TaxID=3346293 RepID=UPI0036DDF2C0